MSHRTLNQAFSDIVEHHGARPALVFDDRTRVTYDELNLRAERLAAYLRHLGVTPEAVVAVDSSKAPDTYACLLACLKIGAPYTLLNPDSPPEHLRKILQRCQPAVLWGGTSLRNKLRSILDSELTGTRSIGSNDLDAFAVSRAETRAELGGDIDDSTAAYIMFTSGSTGFPKGAIIARSSVLNLIHWSIDTYTFGPDDTLTNVNPLHFDNSVFDFYSALFSGATLASIRPEVVRNAQQLVEAIDSLGCTSWFSVPSLLIFLQTMKTLTPDSFGSLTRVIFGGEGYPKAKLQRLFTLYSDRIAFHNVYGPTECTCICSSYRLNEKDFVDLQGLPPLGTVSRFFSRKILGADGNEVPAGEPGELCLLGPNVGLGYINDPETTRTAFAPDAASNSRMYRTGDLVREDPDDGTLHILGRKDHQIKHMGYRIELEEIESALYTLEGVEEAAAVHGIRQGLSRIAACLRTDDSTAQDASSIQRSLKQILPNYMIPSDVHFMETLPKNANGKVDRRVLAETLFPRTEESSAKGAQQ